MHQLKSAVKYTSQYSYTTDLLNVIIYHKMTISKEKYLTRSSEKNINIHNITYIAMKAE